MKWMTIILLTLSVQAFAAQSIDKEAVRKVVKNNLSLFNKCYTDELKNNPDLHGKVILNWDISDTGEVQTASIKSSTLKNDKTEECLVSTLKTLKFPAAPKGSVANINYPFVFSKMK